MLDCLIVVSLFYKALQVAPYHITRRSNLKNIVIVMIVCSFIGIAVFVGLAVSGSKDTRTAITVEEGQSPADFFGPIMAGTYPVKKVFGNNINKYFKHVYLSDNHANFILKTYEKQHPNDYVYIGKNISGLAAAEVGLVIFTDSQTPDKKFLREVK